MNKDGKRTCADSVLLMKPFVWSCSRGRRDKNISYTILPEQVVFFSKTHVSTFIRAV